MCISEKDIKLKKRHRKEERKHALIRSFKKSYILRNSLTCWLLSAFRIKSTSRNLCVVMLSRVFENQVLEGVLEGASNCLSVSRIILSYLQLYSNLQYFSFFYMTCLLLVFYNILTVMCVCERRLESFFKCKVCLKNTHMTMWLSFQSTMSSYLTVTVIFYHSSSILTVKSHWFESYWVLVSEFCLYFATGASLVWPLKKTQNISTDIL